MNLSGLVSVTGKSGLYKLLAQNKTGFILESLDAQKTKLIVNLSTSKLATLEDITVYGNEEDLKLSDIFLNIKNYNGEIPKAKDDSKILKSFFTEVAPDFDEDKVYTSDMKKIISWYHIIKELPLFSENNNQENATEEALEEEVLVAPKTDAKEKSVKKETGKSTPKTKETASKKSSTKA